MVLYWINIIAKLIAIVKDIYLGKTMSLLTDIQYRILKIISPHGTDVLSDSEMDSKNKLMIMLGEQIFKEIVDRTVIDFGCGIGGEALFLAEAGAKKVIGLDIREKLLEIGRKKAAERNLSGRCEFTQKTQERADIIISLDAFEHFEDPKLILNIMYDLLKPGGVVIASFGPTWYHPNGGHLFSVFPWAHLIFSEKALIRWRSDFKDDGATRFCEVAGGLNQMTISRFEKIVADSKFKNESLELVPIRKLRMFHSRLTREFTTSIVRAILLKS